MGRGAGGRRDPSEGELWDISVPCTALSNGMSGEVERTKTVAAMVEVLEVTEERAERAAGRVEGKDERTGGWVEGREENPMARVVGRGRAEERAEAVVEGMRC